MKKIRIRTALWIALLGASAQLVLGGVVRPRSDGQDTAPARHGPVEALSDPKGGAGDPLKAQGPLTEPAAALPRKVYLFSIEGDIQPAALRLVHKSLAEATERGASLILIRLNTYGGLVNVADSVRTALLKSPIPVWVFVDNQAASAGALLALAADTVYMRPGGSIGAASVVDGQGRPMPDKYQSFMRSIMRATAQAHGKVIERIEGEDTLWRWRRDPQLAEAMVGRSVGDSTTAGVLTLTAEEAQRVHFSEGSAESVPELLRTGGVSDYELYEYRPTALDRLMGWLMNPLVQGIFVMMIVGGIYFEMQTPGVGFPLAVALLGAVLYFAPLYLEGVAQYWEVILFVLGVGLLAVEIFVLPGFGVAGVAGVVCVVTGLVFAAIDNDLLRQFPSGRLPLTTLLRPLLVVVIASTAALVGGVWLGRRLLGERSSLGSRLALWAEMHPEGGYTSHPESLALGGLVGSVGEVTAVLRPAGRVLIQGRYYEAAAQEAGFVRRGARVRVERVEGGVLYCVPVDSGVEHLTEP